MAGIVNRIAFGDLDWDRDQCALNVDGPYTGEVVEHDSDGNVVAIIGYRDGFKDGKETHYRPDGRIVFEGTWKRCAGGVGVHRSWYDSGALREESDYNAEGYLERVDRFPDGPP